MGGGGSRVSLGAGSRVCVRWPNRHSGTFEAFGQRFRVPAATVRLAQATAFAAAAGAGRKERHISPSSGSGCLSTRSLLVHFLLAKRNCRAPPLRSFCFTPSTSVLSSTCPYLYYPALFFYGNLRFIPMMVAFGVSERRSFLRCVLQRAKMGSDRWKRHQRSLSSFLFPKFVRLRRIALASFPCPLRRSSLRVWVCARFGIPAAARRAPTIEEPYSVRCSTSSVGRWSVLVSVGIYEYRVVYRPPSHLRGRNGEKKKCVNPC